ncbi:hypothetical protein STRTUCAR8_04717 [Streptomyces turgidiscabies Car8]|uniref:Uncharacterized protein n=1 Tax=Streptomyces turgidiscabies (strain Car8) TaxID=698760 RepID=L7ERX0_STRT8|nr:hypothetical protein STRTUCAR8_04717 [Streptomyces turgidiscabies Car8]
MGSASVPCSKLGTGQADTYGTAPISRRIPLLNLQLLLQQQLVLRGDHLSVGIEGGA